MKYVIYFLLLFFCNCKKKVSSERTLKAISFFNLKQNTLIENEPFRLILCSSVGAKKADSDHLIQFIAIKLNTKDTINILGHCEEELIKEDGDHIFYFIPYQNANEIIEKARKEFKNVDNLQDLISVDNETGEIKIETTMVICDPKLEMMTNNNYPTVIGDIFRKK